MKTYFKNFAHRLIQKVAKEVVNQTLSVQYLMNKQAAESSLEYIVRDMPESKPFSSRLELIDYCLTRLKTRGQQGSYLEFGVYKGESLNFIAERVSATVHGFDSFEGLPESWSGPLMPKGAFTLGGQLPTVRANVALHKGWFDDTIDGYLRDAGDKVAFLHIDCDLYSSTCTVLDKLSGRIGTGTIIQFDEYFGYVGWQDGEFKAFHEFCDKAGLQYRYIGHTLKTQAAVEIL